MTIADYTLPSIFIGLALLIYGGTYYRYAQSMKALGDNARQLLMFTKVSKKLEWFLLVAILAWIGIAITIGMLRGWRAALPTTIQISVWLMFSGTQGIARRFWMGANGFIYMTTFTLWTDVDAIIWDNDVQQQQWGVTLRYHAKGQSKTLKLWIPRKEKPKYEHIFASYSGK